MAITNAYVQSQWEQIKRDIRNGVKEASRETLRQYAKEAMHDIDNQSSYDTDTGNLDESLATGIYEIGKRVETLFFEKSLKDYKSRVSTTVNTRWGYTIKVDKGGWYRGIQESMKALDFYDERVPKPRYPEDMSMVIVAEMFYRYFLESKNGKNWVAGFANYEQSYAKEQLKFKRIWYHNMRSKAKWGKNLIVK